MGLTQSDLFWNIYLYKYAHNSSPKGSPDMVLTAFDMKFHKEKDELPPEAWNQQQIQKIQNRKNMHQEMGHPPARAGGPGGGSSPCKFGGSGGSAPRVASWFLGCSTS